MIRVKDLCPRTLRWVAAELEKDGNDIDRKRAKERRRFSEREIGKSESLYFALWEIRKLASLIETGRLERNRNVG